MYYRPTAVRWETGLKVPVQERLVSCCPPSKMSGAGISDVDHVVGSVQKPELQENAGLVRRETGACFVPRSGRAVVKCLCELLSGVWLNGRHWCSC